MNNEFFTAYDIRGKIADTAFIEIAWNAGKALADWLPTTGSVLVLRGEDTSESVLQAIIEGLRLQGRDVIDVGSGDSAILSDRIATGGYSGGVLVGYDKLSDVALIELHGEAGKLIESETGLTEIEELVEGGNFVPAAVKGEFQKV